MTTMQAALACVVDERGGTRSSTVAEHGPLIYRRTCFWEMCACCGCCGCCALCVCMCACVRHATLSRSLGGNYIPSMLFHRIPSGARAFFFCFLSFFLFFFLSFLLFSACAGQRKHSRSAILPPSFRLHLCCPRACVCAVCGVCGVFATQQAPWVRQRTLL